MIYSFTAPISSVEFRCCRKSNAKLTCVCSISRRQMSRFVALFLSIASVCVMTDASDMTLTSQAYLAPTHTPQLPRNGVSRSAISHCSSTSKEPVKSPSIPEQLARRSIHSDLAASKEAARLIAPNKAPPTTFDYVKSIVPRQDLVTLGGVVSELRSVLLQDSKPTKSTQDCGPNVCIVVIAVSQSKAFLSQ